MQPLRTSSVQNKISFKCSWTGMISEVSVTKSPVDPNICLYNSASRSEVDHWFLNILCHILHQRNRRLNCLRKLQQNTFPYLSSRRSNLFLENLTWDWSSLLARYYLDLQWLYCDTGCVLLEFFDSSALYSILDCEITFQPYFLK